MVITLPSNGLLDTRTLVVGVGFQPIETGAGGLLRPDVARQHAVMAAAFERDIGTPLIYSEGYRPLTRQNLKWSQYLAGGTLAAFPGSSTHGLAETIDYASGVGWPNTAASKWMDAHGPAYGFVADVPSERWHRHYIGNPTITTPPAPAVRPALPKETADMKTIKGGKSWHLIAADGRSFIFRDLEVQPGKIFKGSELRDLFQRIEASTPAQPAEFNDLQIVAIGAVLARLA